MPINIEYVSPDSLTTSPHNPRRIDEESLRRLGVLLDSHGFVDPVIARRQDTLLEVRGRFRICKACEHSRRGGFRCKLRKGCCFGKWRAEPENHCKIGKW